jgi:disulfide bond formation protein DsbB
MEHALRISEHLYGVLLGLYPAHFRAAHGPQMRLTFHDACREAFGRGGAGELLELWLPTLFDLIKSALEERARQREVSMSKEWLSKLAGPLTIIVGIFMLSGLVGDIVWLVRPSEPVWEFFHFTMPMVSLVVMLPAFIATLVRYGETASGLGRLGLIINLAGCGGILLILLVSIPLQNLQPQTRYDGLNVVISVCMVAILIGHVLFGIDALRNKLLSRWNVMPLLVGIVPLLLTVPLIFIDPESELAH